MQNVGKCMLLAVLWCQASMTSAAHCSKGVEIVHVVIVWLKDEFRTDEHIEALIAAHDMLREIPGLASIAVGRSVPSGRPVVDDSFDIGVTFGFCSVEHMHAYLTHPLHVEFLERHVRDTVARIQVYDLDIAAAAAR